MPQSSQESQCGRPPSRQAADHRDAASLMGFENIDPRREMEDMRDALLRQQDLMLQEVHHRVANSLQIIASILLLKSRTVQSEETRMHLKDIHQRLVLVATVQRQLSASGPAGEIEFGPYLAQLCDSLARSMVDGDAVAIVPSATSGTVRSDDAISFGLIVTELVINALKHGFPDGRRGRISVDFAAIEADWRLSVSDDGIGRQPHLADHAGLGTRIVEALARNLNASVEIADGGPGATTTLLHTSKGRNE